MHWKQKSWILIGVLLAALTATRVAAAQVVTTTVADTIDRADGTPATGTVIISWPAFTTGSGEAIPMGSTSATIAAGGALSVQLVPNAGATPIGSYYTVVYHLDDGTVSRQYWVVPASTSAVKVSTIESTVMPISVAMQTVSKSYVDTAIAAAVSGHPLDASPFVQKSGDTMNGPLLLPADPVSATQAADKHYVDASIAAVAGGMGQGGTEQPQPQYAVPAYMLNPSGGMASPGATHLSVDPSGYNLSGYHAAFTSLGVSASQADCNQIGGLFGGNSCLGLSAWYGNDQNSIQWGNVINYMAYGPGQNLGNDGRARQGNPFGIYDNYRVRGGNAANMIAMFGSRVGDWGPWYAYDYSDGGTQAPSDEGLTVAGTYQGGESFGYFHGTILTGGTGAITPTFNFTGGCGSMNACAPTDGGILLDTQTAAAGGYLTGPSVDVSTGAVPLKALPVSTTLPITTAWGHAEGVSIPAQPERNAPAPATIALTMATGSFAPGDHVCVEGTAAAGGFDEQSIIASVSGNSITLPLAYPYTNIAIFRGGPCGTFISFSANLALSGYRTSYHAIASFTGSDLVYAVPSSAGLNQSIGAGLPQYQTEPETTGGTGDPNAAFQTFCGAEIEANLSSTDNPQIDPNVCAWAVGDTVESPHFPVQKVTGMFLLVNQNMPNSSGEGTYGINMQMSGMGAAGATQGYTVSNTNPSAWYTSGGGKLAPPQCAFCAEGTWWDSALLNYAPANSLLQVRNHLPGQTGYNLFQDPSWGSLQLSPAGFTFNGNVNTVGGFNGGGLNVSGSISAMSNGSTALETIIAGAQTNASPLLTVGSYNGSSIALGSVPYGATSPFTPLMNLVTDQAYLHPNGWQIQSYAGGGSAVAALFGSSGPYAGSTNLSIENGTTACAELICLGPAATVDGSGNIAGATISGARLRTTAVLSASSLATDAAGNIIAGSGGGGSGGIGGAGTAGYLPSWTGGAGLGNSHVDDGATTAATITASEPVAVTLTGLAGTPGFALNTSSDSQDATAWTFNNTTGHEYALFSDGSEHGYGFSVYDASANAWQLYVTGGASPKLTLTPAETLAWSTTAAPRGGAVDTGLSRDAAGAVDVGNGTPGDKSGTLNTATVAANLYQGPATAPSGACSAIGWVFSQDGHATFCNGSAWVTKI